MPSPWRATWKRVELQVPPLPVQHLSARLRSPFEMGLMSGQVSASRSIWGSSASCRTATHRGAIVGGRRCRLWCIAGTASVMVTACCRRSRCNRTHCGEDVWNVLLAAWAVWALWWAVEPLAARLCCGEVQRRVKAPGERSEPGARAAGPSAPRLPLSQVPLVGHAALAQWAVTTSLVPNRGGWRVCAGAPA